jgi:hypothetical protein
MPTFKFSYEEKVDMFSVYMKANKNTAKAAEDYLTGYPERNQPNRTFFKKIENNLRLYGSFEKRKDSSSIKHNEDKEVAVLAYVSQHNRTSVREVAKECSTSVGTAHSIMKGHKLHPYVPRPVQTLHPGDSARRIQFCRYVICNLLYQLF